MRKALELIKMFRMWSVEIGRARFSRHQHWLLSRNDNVDIFDAFSRRKSDNGFT